MGARVRLKSTVNIASYPPPLRVILTALKQYGMFLADNGQDWFLSGEQNPGWNDDELQELQNVPASAFEALKPRGEIVYNEPRDL